MALIEPGIGGDALRRIANQHQVLLVVPNGTDGKTGSFYSPEDDRGGIGTGQRWNSGITNDTLPLVERVDDVSFLSSLVENIERNYQTDPNRVYVSGVSDGGFMSQRLVLEANSSFTAAAYGLALLPQNFSQKKLLSPTPILIWIGTEDQQTITLGGNSLLPAKVVNPVETLTWWANANGATNYQAEMAITTPDQNGCYTSLEQYLGVAPALLYRSVGGGHKLPSLNQTSVEPLTNTPKRMIRRDQDRIQREGRFAERFRELRQQREGLINHDNIPIDHLPEESGTIASFLGGTKCNDIEAIEVFWDFLSSY